MSETLTPRDIVTALGGTVRVSRHLGVRHGAVSNAIRDGRFPASWFDTLDGLCHEAKVECPRRLFNWIARQRSAA